MLNFSIYLTKFNFVLIFVLTTCKVSFEEVMTNNYSHKNKKKKTEKSYRSLFSCLR